MSTSMLVQKALAIPTEVRQAYLLGIVETDLHAHICRLLENMEAGARCEITHGRDEYGRDIVLRRSSPFGHEYVAIVVKRGDSKGKISGRSAGAVDEIISQANQSVAHSCELKEIEISRVQIGGVWVMFFGNLTSNAVTRIAAEAPGLKFRPFSIGWLADTFAQHYPEVFFAGAASTYLQDRVMELETHHDHVRRPENFSEWYVGPSLGISQVDAGSFSERLKKALKFRRLSYQQFRSQLTSSRRFVLSASPGMGKSTLLKKLALDLYREALTKTASLGTNVPSGALEIPILVSAKDLAKYSEGGPFLDDFLPPEEIRGSFSVSCLLVDALDEVLQDTQASVLSLADEIARDLDCAMVVSARPVHVVRDLAGQPSPKMAVVHLLPFQYNQALQLIDRLVRDAAIADILKEGIANLQNHMALSPLSVSLLLDIAEAEREVPGTVGEIFDQYMDIALGRYDIERGIEVVFQFFIKKTMLAELAWSQFFHKDRLSISASEFDEYLAKYFRVRGFAEEMIARMKADLDRSGILRFGDDVYFSHRTFLDYFVALYVNGHIEEFPDISKWLAETYFSDKWSEIGFYVFAQRRELFPDFLMEVTMIDRDDVDYHWRRFMIGRILQAAWLSPSEAKRRGIEVGIGSAPKLFDRISSDISDEAPQAIPYGVMAALAEHSYSSRTLCQEVSEVIGRLTRGETVDDLRTAVNLLWANRTRMPIVDLANQADQVLAQMGRLEKSGSLPFADKAIGYLMLEVVFEGDKLRQRAITRRFSRLLKSQPNSIRKLLVK